jgi:hypothetical protein
MHMHWSLNWVVMLLNDLSKLAETRWHVFNMTNVEFFAIHVFTVRIVLIMTD